MKVSLSWLRDYVAIDVDVEKLAEALTMVGLEVDALVDRYGYLEGVVVGRIVKMTAHPDAETFAACKVDVGTGIKSIVCGAHNIKVGDLVPTALPGVRLPSGDTIEAGRVRGKVSEGMLCSEAELALGPDSSGILLLPQKAIPGTGLAAALHLSDTIMEFELTPNRPDCLSVIGIAREVAAILKMPLKYPELKLPPGEAPIEELTSVTIDAPDHCPRYAARVILDVKIGPSPWWIQEKLHSVGLRAINNVVDVTNFVLMEMGQPLHAFDFDRLTERRIVVRTAHEGQSFNTLDGVSRVLSTEMLMICDGVGPVALAGIMGGLESEIRDETQAVLIESAYFNPVTTRRTAKRLGLNTESSYRFERGVDPEGVIKALDRAAQLMLETAGGRLTAGLIDNYPRRIPERAIELSVARTNRLLGTKFGQDEIGRYLESMEMNLEPVDDDRLKVMPPTFRVDVKRPEDLMEEVARLTGYDQIATTHPVSRVVANPRNKNLQVRGQARQIMSACGFSEIITYSFIGRDACDRLLLPDGDIRRHMVPLLNPLTEDQAFMRTSLLPGLLATLRKNRIQRKENLKLFELGKIFLDHSGRDKDRLPKEVYMISGLWTGARYDRTWHFKGEQVDFYDMKGVVEALYAALNIPQPRFAAVNGANAPYLNPTCAAEVYLGEEKVGQVGELLQTVLKHYEFEQATFCFDLNFEQLARHASDEKRERPISKFPATTRDIALIVDQTVEVQAVLDYVAAIGQDLIGGVEVFDVYEGPAIPQGKRSVAFRFTYQSFERNLTDSEVNASHETVTQKILKKFKAQLPPDRKAGAT